jgi:HSP20 family protein
MVATVTGFENTLFDEFRRLQQEVDELFNGRNWSGDIRSLPRGTYPAINIAATPEKVDVYLFAPGIDPKTLSISLQQNVLSVAGSRQTEPKQDVSYYRHERFGGDFRRVVSLPEDVDPERVDARYTDGVVRISVQRRQAAKARQIEIH